MKRTALGEGAGALFGPLLTLRAGSLNDCVACEGLARRGRRHPAGAHAGTVYASLRLRCAARPGVAPRTRCAHFVRYAQTGGAKSVLEARWRAPTPGLRCSPPQKSPPPGAACRAATVRFSATEDQDQLANAPPRRSERVSAESCETQVVFATKTTRVVARQALPVGGDFCGGEQRSSGVGARSAPPKLTRRVCLSGVSVANVASSAARPQSEQHSGVAAKRRPPQHEPPAGSGCRAAPHAGKSTLANGNNP